MASSYPSDPISGRERTVKLFRELFTFPWNPVKSLLNKVIQKGWSYWLPWGGVTAISTMTSAIFALGAANTGTAGGEPWITAMLAVIALLFLTVPPLLMAIVINSLGATGRSDQQRGRRDLKAKG